MRARLLAMAPKALLCLAAVLLMTSPLRAGFDIVFKLIDAEQFDAEAIEALNAAFVDVERLWEGIIQGHQQHDQPVVFEIEVGPTDESVASGGPVDPQSIGDFTLPTAGAVYVDPDWVVRATDGFVPAAAGINLLDELLAHEVGHALGFGDCGKKTACMSKTAVSTRADLAWKPTETNSIRKRRSFRLNSQGAKGPQMDIGTS